MIKNNIDAQLSWSLEKNYPELWKKFINLYNLDLAKVFSNNYSELSIPTIENLDDFVLDNIVRPPGSRRAFYVIAKNKMVIAVKGTEIVSKYLKKAFIDDASKKIPNRPWTRFQNFIYREQKAPLAVFLNEALEEANISATYQKKFMDHFGRFEEAPLPLFVHKWNDKVVKKYLEILEPFLASRSKELLIPLIQKYGLGTIIYFYPYLPTRIRFQLPQSVETFNQRNSHVYGEGPDRSGIASMKNLIEIVARMLVLGYLPLSFDDHGIGQCIAPQNVTVRGGICDMGSMYPISKVKNDKDFYQLLSSLSVILTRTTQELLLEPLPNLVYEFDDPSTSSFLMANTISRRLVIAYEAEAKRINSKLDPRILKFFKSDNDAHFTEVLERIFN
jgi:hypothetical protein